MGVFERLVKNIIKVDYTSFDVIEWDDGDVVITFGDSKTKYTLDLEWDEGVMDIQFGASDDISYDTTNVHKQYEVLNKVSDITQKIANTVEKETGVKFHTVAFKSSHVRNGEIDTKSSDIRNRFFSRYVKRRYPNAEVSIGEYNSIIIKLNRV